jgi:hypothetical protein
MNLRVRTILLVLLCIPANSRAEFVPGPIDDKGAFTFVFENDILGALGTDRHYTQGMRLSYLSGEERVWGWVKSLAHKVPLYPENGRMRATWSLGQNLYTPEDIKTAELVVDDRPYAGWLHAAVGLVTDTRRSLDVVEFSVGVVGPAAMGEELQGWFHGVIDSPDPKGWDNQLQNELTLQLFVERKWRTVWEPGWLQAIGLQADVTPHVGGALGNVFIHGAGGGTLRLGSDLPADYGTPRIRPSLPGSEFFVPRRSFAGYFFAGVEGRAVLRNMFLDGNTFKESHSVEKFPFVGDFQGGIALVGFDMRAAFTYVIRTREFVLQNGIDRFGAITLSFRI